MRCIRPTIVGITLALLVSLVTVQPSAAGATIDPIAAARNWLVAQQQPDGGFELAKFPGFETPDAILAIATAGQTGSTWSEAEALAAVEAVDVNGGSPGGTPLDWVDDLADGRIDLDQVPGGDPPGAGLRAKLALLVALPLGLDPANFDPKGGGVADLTDGLDSISPGLFNSFLVGRLVEAGLDQNVHQDDLQSICEAQQASGGWSFDADPTGGTDPDADTAGFAAMALVAAGMAPGDAVATTTKTFFETAQDQVGLPAAAPPVPAGGFFSFGQLDANATTMAVLGYAATGSSPVTLPRDPAPFLESQQVITVGAPPDDVIGRIRSPNDAFGVNTFATSQTIQGLALLAGSPTWLPLSGQDDRQCLPAHSFNDVPPAAWNDNALRWLAEFDLAAGFPDGSFGPLGVFNRAQASQWFDRFFPEVSGGPHGFTDVAPWFTAGANFVGDPAWPGGAIADGFPNDEFRGTAPFNRGQAILWMWKAAGRPIVAQPHEFADGAPWFNQALDWATFHGIVSGFTDNTFRPGAQINRGQGASWFYNLAASPGAWGPAITRPSTIAHTVLPS